MTATLTGAIYQRSRLFLCLATFPSFVWPSNITAPPTNISRDKSYQTDVSSRVYMPQIFVTDLTAHNKRWDVLEYLKSPTNWPIFGFLLNPQRQLYLSCHDLYFVEQIK